MLTFTNAKINLGLRIVRRLSNGYHDIKSLMVPVAWHDILEAVPSQGSPGVSLTVTGRGVDCPPEKNLVMKAVRALEAATGLTLPPTDIFLRKIVPDGAGLGGGSADAASMLCMLRDMYSLGLTDDDLAGVAAMIGADCPFFIYDRVMAVSGTGTTMQAAPEAEEALRQSGLNIIIAKPAAGVSTKEAYAGVTPRPLDGPTPAWIVANIEPEEWASAGLINDFEPSVMAKCPEIAAIKERMTELGAVYASMTGSGSAVFGLFREGCDILSDVAQRVFSACDTFVGSLVQNR